MINERPTIHVHLGVDRLFEDFFEKMLTLPLPLNRKPWINFIPDAFYKKHFRAAIDGGHLIVNPDELKEGGFKANVLAMSRPRFFYTNSPLNSPSAAKGAFYKLDGLQAVFSNYRLIFHLFLADHLTYLFGLGKRSINLDPNSEVSCIPLLDGVRAKVHQQNELRIHDAENAMLFHKSLIAEFLGLDEPDASALYQRHFRVAEPDSSEIERSAEVAGWNIDKLDNQYARDIDHLSFWDEK